jgi:hypothetical protein
MYGVGSRGRSGVDTQLVEDVADVPVHGSFADEQLSGYGVVAHPGDFTVRGIEDVPWGMISGVAVDSR